MDKVNLSKFLKLHKRILLDTMVFIYQFEADPHFSMFTRQIFKALEAGKCGGIISAITLHELLVKPKKEGNIPLVLQYTHLLTSVPYLTLGSIGQIEAETAAGIRAKYGLTAPDALVIASGLANQADGFITADKKLGKLAEIHTFIL